MKKNPVISALRVCSMFSIVLCHIVKYYPFIPGFNHINQFLNIGVQVFLMISGFLYGGKNIHQFGAWYRGRACRIALPVALVAAVDLLALACMGWRTDGVTAAAYLLNLQGLLFLNWGFFSRWIHEVSNLGPLWFATVIMLCYLLIPLLQKLRAKWRGTAHCKRNCLILTGGMLAASLVSSYFNIISLSYFMMFTLGYLFAMADFSAEKTTGKTAAVLGIVTLLLQGLRVGLRLSVADTNHALYAAYTILSHGVLGVWIFYCFFWIGKKAPKALSRLMSTGAMRALDRYSYEVYLVHGLFCMPGEGTLNAFNVYAMNLPLFGQTLLFILAVASFAICLAFVSNRINEWVQKLENRRS